MKNIEKAVVIIAGLSLLLGLSLGQNHRQYLKLKAVETASVAPLPERAYFDEPHFRCGRQNAGIREKMAELRMRLEEKKLHLENRRREVEEARLRALQEGAPGDIRLEVQDPETGANTIIRIVREE